MLLETKSLAGNYELLHQRVLARSGDFITAVIRESPPHLGRDGLMSMTTDAVVDVKAVQKSLNVMSRDQRVKLIRASGDPSVSVRVGVRDSDRAGAPAMPSPAAENILKERIKSFGFRTWAEADAAPERKSADFAVVGEARIRKLSTRLEASGLVISKFALTSWTVKCIDRQSGEEIHHNTAVPTAMGSWASEEEAMRAIGAGIADQLSRDLFLRHTTARRQKIALEVEGMPEGSARDELARELIGLPQVIAVAPIAGGGGRGYDLQMIGNAPPGDLVATRVLEPLNAKLGQTCFRSGSAVGSRVVVRFEPACAEPSVLERLELNPPAGLYGAPPARQRTVVKNPDTLRKLVIPS
jgi:serine/threonine-protein kinase